LGVSIFQFLGILTFSSFSLYFPTF
jgi:hypothetical protein